LFFVNNSDFVHRDGVKTNQKKYNENNDDFCVAICHVNVECCDIIMLLHKSNVSSIFLCLLHFGYIDYVGYS